MNVIQNIFLKTAKINTFSNGCLPKLSQYISITGPRVYLHNSLEPMPLINEKGRPLSIVEKQKFSDERPFRVIKELLSEYDKTLTKQDWFNLKSKALECGGRITEISFNGIVLRSLHEIKDIPLSKSFLKFIEDNQNKHGVLIWSYKMALIADSKDKNKNEEILKIYEIIKSKDTIYDASTLENLIYGLSVTSSWKECLKLLEDPIVTPTPQTFSFIIMAAFRNEDFKTGFQFMKQLVNRHQTIEDHIHLEFFRSISRCSSRNEDKMKKITQYCKLLENHFVVPSVSVAEEFKDLVNRLFPHLATAGVTISRDGQCNHCQTTLPPARLSPQQFDCLQKAVFKHIVTDTNIYYNTTPKELRNFVKFVEARKPFDVVIDGLNVILGQKKKGDLTKRLLSFVEHYVNHHKMKVLVLGRSHMVYQSRATMAKVQALAEVYLLQNVSRDDPLLLYAAMLSGPNTYVITKDMLRNHLNKLPDLELKYSFSIWQASRQIFPEFLPKDTKSPPEHKIALQGSLTSGLHLPYGQPKDCYDFVKTWLCIKPH